MKARSVVVIRVQVGSATAHEPIFYLKTQTNFFDLKCDCRLLKKIVVNYSN